MKEESKSIFGVAYLCIMITAILRLVSGFTECIVAGNRFGEFFKSQLVWLVVATVMIFALYRLNKKQNQSAVTPFRDNTDRKAAGILILISGLLSLSAYVYSIANAVSLVREGKSDSTVMLIFVSFIFILCLMLIGIYMLKCKGKVGENFSSKTALGIAFLYTAINTAFSLVSKLSQLISSSKGINAYYFLWYIITAAILAVLYVLNKKQNQDLISAFQDEIIRKSAGVLILTGGLISMPDLINKSKNIIIFIASGYGTKNNMHSNIVLTIIDFAIALSQIALGVYMLRKTKPEQSGSDDEES